MERILGLLVALLGAISALLWILRRKGIRQVIHDVEIRVAPKKGVCGIPEASVRDVTIHRDRGDRVHWIIMNRDSPEESPCDRRVKVCIAPNWTFRKEPGDPKRPSDPPVQFLDNGRTCRTVKRGDRQVLPAKAKRNADPGYYEYEIEIDDKPAVDPIVRIVP